MKELSKNICKFDPERRYNESESLSLQSGLVQNDNQL